MDCIVWPMADWVGCAQLQRQQMAKIPGMLNPHEVKEEVMGE